MINWKDKLRASGLHLCISLFIATLAGLLVFAVWYPYPYREISGGRELFFLVATVDVVLGPLITLAIFNRSKRARELILDLSLVGVLQLAGLGYGLWTVAAARPVHLVFEIDRLRVVHAIDIPPELMARKSADLPPEPWNGPTLLAVRPFRDAQEDLKFTMQALSGLQLSAQPDLWQPYDAAKARVLKAAQPVAGLKTRFPDRAAEIDTLLRQAGRDPSTALFLPVNSRDFFWTAIIDPKSAEIVAFTALDSF